VYRNEIDGGMKPERWKNMIGIFRSSNGKHEEKPFGGYCRETTTHAILELDAAFVLTPPTGGEVA